MQIISIGLMIFNLTQYSSNSGVVVAITVSLILLTVSLIFFVKLFKKSKILDTKVESLKEGIQRKFNFMMRNITLMHHTISLNAILLGFSITLFVENNNGVFMINKVWLYLALNILSYIGLYLYFKLSNEKYLKSLIEVLANLSDSSEYRIEDAVLSYRFTVAIAITIILAFVLIGAVFFLFCL